MPEAISSDIIELPPVIRGVGMGFVGRFQFPDHDITESIVSVYLEDRTTPANQFSADSTGDLVTIVEAAGDLPNLALIQIPSDSIDALAVAGLETDFSVDVAVDADSDPFIRIQGVVKWNKRGGLLDD